MLKMQNMKKEYFLLKEKIPTLQSHQTDILDEAEYLSDIFPLPPLVMHPSNPLPLIKCTYFVLIQG